MERSIYYGSQCMHYVHGNQSMSELRKRSWPKSFFQTICFFFFWKIHIAWHSRKDRKSSETFPQQGLSLGRESSVHETFMIFSANHNRGKGFFSKMAFFSRMDLLLKLNQLYYLKLCNSPTIYNNYYTFPSIIIIDNTKSLMLTKPFLLYV